MQSLKLGCTLFANQHKGVVHVGVNDRNPNAFETLVTVRLLCCPQFFMQDLPQDLSCKGGGLWGQAGAEGFVNQGLIAFAGLRSALAEGRENIIIQKNSDAGFA